MNKILKIFFGAIYVALSAMSVNAQTTILCPDISLPYYVYDQDPSGSGPNGWTDENDPAYLLYENPTYSILRWQGTKPIVIQYTTPQLSQHTWFNNCIKQADLDACIANDLTDWTNICPGMFSIVKVPSIAPGENGITMEWDDEEGDFTPVKDNNGKVVSDPGAYTDQFNGVNHSTLSMSNPIIYVNNTNTFNDNFVYTTCPQTCTITSPYHPVSICEVMLHEIGHAFGLYDLMNDPGGAGNEFPQSVMLGEIQATSSPCPDKGPQDIDRCYFCKLYCASTCETLGAPLPSDDTSMRISVYPNPATLSFTITYKSLEPYSSLSIQNIMGEQILRQKLTNSEGTILESCDKMPAGAYLIRLQGSEHFIVRLLIIQ